MRERDAYNYYFKSQTHREAQSEREQKIVKARVESATVAYITTDQVVYMVYYYIYSTYYNTQQQGKGL